MWYVHIRSNKYINVPYYVHSASTNKDFALPGHGSPLNFLLDTGMVHVLLPKQAYRKHNKKTYVYKSKEKNRSMT